MGGGKGGVGRGVGGLGEARRSVLCVNSKFVPGTDGLKASPFWRLEAYETRRR